MNINSNNKLLAFLIFISISLSSNILAKDFRQFLPEMSEVATKKQINYLIKKYKKKNNKNNWEIYNEKEDNKKNDEEIRKSKKESSYAGNIESKNVNIKNFNKKDPYFYSSNKWKSLSETKIKDYLDNRNKIVEHGVGINLLYNNLEYSNGTFDFSKTYKSTTNSSISMLALISYFKYINDSWFKLGLNINTGFGINTGQGYFSGEDTLSYANFKLWSLPIDLGVSTDINLFELFSLNISAGPSFLFVVENRSDKTQESNERDSVQYSFGYYTNASLDINFYHLFPNYIFKIYKTYNAHSSYVSFFTRYSNYSKFQESSVSISGLCFGLGIKVEFY
jgi:hypothetical protein